MTTIGGRGAARMIASLREAARTKHSVTALYGKLDALLAANTVDTK